VSSRLPSRLVDRLRSAAGRSAVLTDPADCWAYGYDNSRRQALPDAVVLASTHEQVAAVVGLCSAAGVPLVARGRGTGTTGATVPVRGGVVLSLERMNRVLALEPRDRLARVEPGLTNQALQDAVAAHGFFWPPDPTSAAVCTVGGNLACNAAGPRAIKYGTTRDNTLGLRAVTGAGEAIRTGVATTKGVVGYDLTRLLIGSEGTLAVITEATLRLTPLPEARHTLQATYRTVGAAAAAVSAIMAQPVTPCALELMDRGAIDMIRGYQDLGLTEAVSALLMIEIDGPRHGLGQAVDAVAAAAAVDGLIGIARATDATAAADLWRARRALSPALRNVAPKKINEDVVVPVSRIPALIDGLGELAARHGITIVNFGHAGNGNIHVNLLVDPDDAAELARAERCLDETFDLVLRLGGTLSGEHGVGLVKREFVRREIDPASLRLMRDLKRVFDPNGILNPDKSLPD
jgi:D-lactate dehydrogenase